MNNPVCWFCFEQYGYPEWVPVDSQEIEIIWAGLQTIFDTSTPEEIQYLYDTTRLNLVAQIWCNFECTPMWITKAVMLTAIRGWQGHDISADFVCDR